MKKRYMYSALALLVTAGSLGAQCGAHELSDRIDQTKEEVSVLLSTLQQEYNESEYVVQADFQDVCSECNQSLQKIASQIGELAERLYQLELRLVYLEEDLNGTRLVIGDPGEEVVNFEDLNSIEKINNAQLTVEQWLKTLYARLDSHIN